ncbi:MAG: transketolase family protein [Magnetospirillum sp.]
MNAAATDFSTVDMRDAFFLRLYDIARQDPAVVLLSNDFGAPSLDRFRADLAGQFVNAAISEQNMISMAAGMAMAGRKPVVYSIASFLTLRALEQVKVDICVMGAKVMLVGVGCGYAYSVDGPTHHATEDIAIMRALSGMAVWSPSESPVAGAMADLIHDLPGPAYLRFDRGRWPSLGELDLERGLRVLGSGDDVVIVATGIMTHRALAVAEALRQSGTACRVVDLVRLSPPARSELAAALAAAGRVVTIEEQAAPGGLGGLVAEFMADEGLLRPLLRLAIDPAKVFAYGERDRLHRDRGLDLDGAVTRIGAWMGR